MHPHNGHYKPDPTRDPVVPPEPHPVVKFLARVVAGLILLACAGTALGCVVRVFQWVWPD